MRIALVVHGLPPRERTGVETHVASLAATLSAAGAEVLVLAARKDGDLRHLAERRERREGYVVDWLVVNEPPRDVLEEAAPPGVAEAVGEWLDREQPDVVHVHHVKGLGWGVLEEVRARGLPLVFTAHDYYGACHRVTRLRPDLERCEVFGDAARCARCDLAVGVLHGCSELGDWHMGVFPDQLDEATRARLAQALDGEPDPEALESAVERRRAADALRARALAGVDLAIAPTERVAQALARGGVAQARLRRMPYAIDLGDLEGLPAAGSDERAHVRFGFLGGLAKHKGAHVLVEAFRGVQGAELHVFGDSSDRPYVERVRALCLDVGARWRGAFEAGELPRVLESLDVICVPSLWDENAPFAIREAFAAGRPVLASHVGALPESVRDGIDGLLVAPGDVDAWRAALTRLARERGELRRLAGGVEPPPGLHRSARELLAMYADLVVARCAAQPEESLPEHLWVFEGRRRALQREPLDNLFERVRSGLGALRAALAPQSEDALAREPGPALERARELLRERRREARWARSAAADDRLARGSLAAEVRWLRGVLGERERELTWRRDEAEASAAAAAAEFEALRAEVAARQAEAAWLREAVVDLEHEREGRERAASERERALAALAEHERWLREEARGLAETLGAPEAGTERPDEPIAPERLATAVGQARQRADVLRSELSWRRTEMERALCEGGPLLRALVRRSALGRRIRAWRGQRPEGAA